MLRGAFIIVFGVTGFLLGREAYFSLFSLHFASEALQLAFSILSPVVGAIVGALLAPLAQALFEGQLDLAEGAMERLTPAEIAGGAVGLIVGLMIAFLIKSIVFEMISDVGRAGTYVAIVLYLILRSSPHISARASARRFGSCRCRGRLASAGGNAEDRRYVVRSSTDGSSRSSRADSSKAR